MAPHTLEQATMSGNGNGNGRSLLQLVVGDKKLLVEPLGLIGQYAVHLRVRAGEVKGPGWTVTHQGTGCSIWHVETEVEAIRVARWLDEKGPKIPEEAADTWAWRRSLTTTERTRLVAQLSEIAARQL